MLKKISTVFLSALMALLCVSTTFAENSEIATLEIISSYYLGNEIFCYIQPSDPDYEISEIEASIVTNGSAGNERKTPEVVGGSESAVSYMLLIDLSTSMPSYRNYISSFAGALLQAEKQETRIMVATFGERFEVVESDLTNLSQVRQALNTLSYDQKASDICGGVIEATQYLTNYPRAEGEIVNLIVLTDGVTYLADTGADKDGIDMVAKIAKAVIEASPEVIIHSVGFGAWEAATLDAISSGAGINLSVEKNSDAANAGTSIAQFVDDLYYLTFPSSIQYNEKAIKAQLMLSDPSGSAVKLITLKNLRNLNYSDYTLEDAGIFEDAWSAGDNGTGAENKGGQDDGEDATNANGVDPSGSGSENNGGNDEIGDNSTGIEEESPDNDKSDDKSNHQKSGWMKWVLIAAGIAAIALAVALISMGRKKSNVSMPLEDSDIWVRLEMLSGISDNLRDEYPLTDELTIGSGRSCDIILSNETVSPRNTRIYLKDGIVYIEDLNSYSNTSIGGMKIHAPNRLRNGDEVTIGRVRFRVELLKSR